MTFLEAAAAVLSAGWSALSGLVYPGTSVSYAGIAIGALVAAISLRIAGHLVGVHYSFGSGNFFSSSDKPVDSLSGAHVASPSTGDYYSKW